MLRDTCRTALPDNLEAANTVFLTNTCTNKRSVLFLAMEHLPQPEKKKRRRLQLHESGTLPFLSPGALCLCQTLHLCWELSGSVPVCWGAHILALIASFTIPSHCHPFLNISPEAQGPLSKCLSPGKQCHLFLDKKTQTKPKPASKRKKPPASYNHLPQSKYHEVGLKYFNLVSHRT